MKHLNRSCGPLVNIKLSTLLDYLFTYNDESKLKLKIIDVISLK